MSLLKLSSGVVVNRLYLKASFVSAGSRPPRRSFSPQVIRR